MAEVRVLVLQPRAPTAMERPLFAFELAGATTEQMRQSLLEEPAILDRFQILCAPGGFSYGGDLAAGRILGQPRTAAW